MTNGTPPVAQPQQKKGLPALAWVGIGCGVLLLVVVIVLVAGGMFMAHKVKEMGLDPELWEKQPALAASKVIATFNPDLEVVEVDEDEGKITVRNTKTDEVFTVDLDDVKKGEIHFKNETTGKEISIEAGDSGEEGERTVTVTDESGTEVMTIGGGTSAQVPSWVPIYPGTEPTGHFTMTSDSGTNVSFSLQTDDAVQKVLSFYKEKLEAEGFTTSVSSFSGDGSQGAFVSARDEAGGRTVQVSIGSEGGSTTVNLNCTEKK